MTPTTKPDPKGVKKVATKTTKTSSTLSAISKMGGGTKTGSGTIGLGKARKKGEETPVEPIAKTNVSSNKHEERKSSGSNEKILWKADDEENVVVSSDFIAGEEKTNINGGKKASVEMKIHDGAGDVEMNDKEEEEEDFVNSARDLVRECEQYVLELEMEFNQSVEGANKDIVAGQIDSAQRRLKDALINLSIAERVEHARKEKVKQGNRMTGKRAGEAVIAIDDEEDHKKQTSDDADMVEADTGKGLDDTQENHVKETKKVKNVKDAGSIEGSKKVPNAGNGKRWEDMSDDETVVLQNLGTSDNAEGEWEVVKNKKVDKNIKQSKEQQKQINKNTTGINNPYSAKPKEIVTAKQRGEDKMVQSSLATFAAAAKGKLRQPNQNSIRAIMSFTPRTASTTELKRVAMELLTYANEFEPDAMLLPWEDTNDYGPIKVSDLENPQVMHDAIRYYFNRPAKSAWQANVPIYGVGIRFSVNSNMNTFMDKWNINKKEYKLSNKIAHTINLAPMQKSPKSFIIGIAVGSSENQDNELLNARLEYDTGIKGIETSFQNIHQYGVTPEFWKMANSKALEVNKDKISRGYLRTKYLWAPNALAVYVANKEDVGPARKKMLQKYGMAVNGVDPVWPDGSSMRFLPIKGTGINNDKTRDIVRKRLAYHIWLKAHELSIETELINIHESIDVFEGKTLADIVLAISNESDGLRLFTHFNRAWSSDPTKQKWTLSVRNHLIKEARNKVAHLKDILTDTYGPDIEHFFVSNHDEDQTWRNAYVSSSKEEDDNWFDNDENEIEILIEKGILDNNFLAFLNSKVGESDKQSVVSWGTGDTAYTEMVTTHASSGTGNTSSLTNDSSPFTTAEKKHRIGLVKQKLLSKGISSDEFEAIRNNETPYELAFSGITLSTWDVDKEVFLILAIKNQFQPKPTNDHDK